MVGIESLTPKPKIKSLTARIAMIFVFAFALLETLIVTQLTSASTAGIWSLAIGQFLLGLVLIVEGSWQGMWSRKALQNVGPKQFLGYLSTIMGGVLIGMGILTTQLIPLEVIPEGIINFLNFGGAIIWVLVAILAFINIFAI